MVRICLNKKDLIGSTASHYKKLKVLPVKLLVQTIDHYKCILKKIVFKHVNKHKFRPLMVNILWISYARVVRIKCHCI